MILLISGLALLLGVHSISIVVPDWRDRIAARIGLRPWQVIYAVLSVVGLVMIVKAYGDLRNQTAILYMLPRWVNGITTLLMLPVFPLLLATFLPGMISTAARHPLLVAVKLWAFAHLLANGSVADVVLFGSFLAWAVIDRISLKRRPSTVGAAVPARRYNDAIALGVGFVLYALMLNGGHRLLIGMPLV